MARCSEEVVYGRPHLYRGKSSSHSPRAKFVRRILDFLKKSKHIKKSSSGLRNAPKTRAKTRKWLACGLIVFVGIPLPGTGAWTGSLAADLFRIDFKKSMFAVTVGVLIAAAIVTVICYAFPALASQIF